MAFFKMNLSMDVLEQVLALVREMGRESQVSGEVLNELTPTTSFEKDLGIDSLAKVELIDRVESTFKVTLSTESFALINTPLDLAQKIEEAASESKTSLDLKQTVVKERSHVSAPLDAGTLLGVLDWHLKHNPERIHIRLFQDDGSGPTMTYGQLFDQSKKIGEALNELGINVGDRVAIMLPTSFNYFYCFIGVLLSGAVPVPVYPPIRRDQLREHVERHEKILNNAGAVMLIATHDIKLLGRYLKSKVKSMETVVTPEELFTIKGTIPHISRKPQDLALIQYTSGSTGDPKGVALTHQALLSNIRAMGEALRVTSKDVVASWLPLYHDMGLIGTWMSSLYFGAELILMSPYDFITRPMRLLWAIHHYQCTLTAAPNFAYELCLKRARDMDLKDLDLSSMRAMLNGAEPVSPDTLEHFGAFFSQYGLNEKALMPVYGLAENSVALTFPPVGRGPLIKTIDRNLLMKRGIVKEVDLGMKVVSNGRPLPGHEIQIVDELTRPVNEGVVGEVEFKGPSSTNGYFNAAEKNKSLFHNKWLKTGDLGFLLDGELYITGRKKDIIIKAGRNIAPQELEEKVGRLAGVRKGSVVAFAVTDPSRGSERLVIAVETKHDEPGTKERLIKEVNALTADLLETGADEVLILPPHSLLKTSSGKIRRSACKEAYGEGTLGQLEDKGLVLWHVQVFLTVLKTSLMSHMKRSGLFLLRLFFDFYFFVLLGLFILPTVLWIRIAPYERKWKGVSGLIMTFLKLTGTRLSIKGIERLPSENQPCIFVANHNSYIDAVILGAVLRRPLAFMAKKELKRNPFFKLVLPPLDTIFVDRYTSSQSITQLKEAQELQKRKKISLFFFPEGTFSGNKKLLRFHMGAFMTAATLELPIVPLAVIGTSRMFGWDEFFPWPKNDIHVQIGAPILPHKNIKEEEEWKEALLLRNTAHGEILRALQ